MSIITGILGTESMSANRFKSIRREVAYQYPNGAAPLNAILSMLDDESLNDPEFKQFEKRLQLQQTTTASANAAGPFTTSGGDVDSTAAGFNLAADGAIRLKVASTERFRVGHVLEIRDVPNGAASALMTLRFKVITITAATKLELKALEAYNSISNDTDANSLTVNVIGTAFAQGAVGSSDAPYETPLDTLNYAQIFRTKFSFTGTQLKTSLIFDETGPYADKAKDASLMHAIEMEKAFIFGVRSKTVDGTSNLPTYTTGGILWWLKQWELGRAANGGEFEYRPTGSDVTAAADSTDDKRIIANSTGKISLKTLEGYWERAFRSTSNKSAEKLVLCGSGALSTFNQLYQGKLVQQTGPMAEGGFGMRFTSQMTPHGDLFFKTHPLFTQDPVLRYAALVLDVGNLKYRYVDGRDTEILENRQANDADYRTDEWLSEAGLEVLYPESHMFLQNLTQAIN